MKSKKKLKSLAEHNAQASAFHNSFNYMGNPIKNGLACPKCGNELLDSTPNMTLTSMPPKKSIHCDKCEYKSYRIV